MCVLQQFKSSLPLDTAPCLAGIIGTIPTHKAKSLGAEDRAR
jgi:hypothetical protein